MGNNMEDKLGQEFEEWLDSTELTLPIPVPEEETLDGKIEVDTADICKVKLS